MILMLNIHKIRKSYQLHYLNSILISGNDSNDEHLNNNPLISVVFNFDISGNDFNDEEFENISFANIIFFYSS